MLRSVVAIGLGLLVVWAGALVSDPGKHRELLKSLGWYGRGEPLTAIGTCAAGLGYSGVLISVTARLQSPQFYEPGLALIGIGIVFVTLGGWLSNRTPRRD